MKLSRLLVPSKDGPVFVGLFQARDTHGVPLVIAMRALLENKVLFSVPHFVRDALAAGWSSDKVMEELRAAWTELLPRSDVDSLLRFASLFAGKKVSLDDPEHGG